MKIEQKVEIEATIRNILLSLVDFGVVLFKAGDKGRVYSKPISDYWQWREKDSYNFSKNLYYLKKRKMIKEFIKQKKTHLELTAKGRKIARDYYRRSLEIKRPKKWDGKWRVIIFDIPENRKSERETIRKWLKNLGLIELQKSVYVHPFDCKQELDFLVSVLNLSQYIKYLICDIIQGEQQIIDYFFKEQIITKNHLKVK